MAHAVLDEDVLLKFLDTSVEPIGARRGARCSWRLTVMHRILPVGRHGGGLGPVLGEQAAAVAGTRVELAGVLTTRTALLPT